MPAGLEGLDFARPPFRPDAVARAHHPGRRGQKADRWALCVFLVDLRENLGHGVEIRPIEAMINHNTTEVFFDNLQVPPENLIGEKGRGFRYILDGMNAERILVAQECIGDGRWLLNKGIEYAKERIVFYRPIG
jgi:acyl-CoA dehydrogenase